MIMLQLGGPGSIPSRSINISEDCGLLNYNTLNFGGSPTFLSSRSPPILRVLPKSHGGTVNLKSNTKTSLRHRVQTGSGVYSVFYPEEFTATDKPAGT